MNRSIVNEDVGVSGCVPLKGARRSLHSLSKRADGHCPFSSAPIFDENDPATDLDSGRMSNERWGLGDTTGDHTLPPTATRTTELGLRTSDRLNGSLRSGVSTAHTTLRRAA